MATEFSRETELPIVDMTGLTGRFDFPFNTQKYVTALRERLAAEPRPISNSDANVIVFQDAMAGEMGLLLEVRRTSVEVVVIDHAEKTPVEN